MSNSFRLRLGTRGSLLARAQSGMVADELMQRHAGVAVELVIIKTSGDKITDRPLHEIGGKGLFTKELEQALLAGEIDLAVHSLKDVPVTMPLVAQENLIIAAVPAREDARDALASMKHRRLADLPAGARVGTSSLRRRCQVLAVRPDVRVEPLRGNMDSRLRKMRDGEFDAIVLAMAGLKRSGLLNAAEMTPIELDEMLPAPGQGALALQCRRDDGGARELLGVLHDGTTGACISVERAIVAGLNGDCHSPIAALASVQDGRLTLRAKVGAFGGELPIVSAMAAGAVGDSDSVVKRVLEELSKKEARELLRSPF